MSYLKVAFGNIAEELRRQYSLGYYPNQSARMGDRLRIKVEVSWSDLVVRARGSYIYQPATAASKAAATSDKPKDNEQRTSAPVLKKPFTRLHDPSGLPLGNPGQGCLNFMLKLSDQTGLERTLRESWLERSQY